MLTIQENDINQIINNLLYDENNSQKLLSKEDRLLIFNQLGIGMQNGTDDEVKKKKGLYYELYVGKYYEDTHNATVEYRGLKMGRNDGGIDLIVTYPNKNQIFVQCKNWKLDTTYDITGAIVKEFLYNCIYQSKKGTNYNNIQAYFFTPELDLYSCSAKLATKAHNESNLGISCTLKILPFPDKKVINVNLNCI